MYVLIKRKYFFRILEHMFAHHHQCNGTMYTFIVQDLELSTIMHVVAADGLGVAADVQKQGTAGFF